MRDVVTGHIAPLGYVRCLAHGTEGRPIYGHLYLNGDEVRHVPEDPPRCDTCGRACVVTLAQWLADARRGGNEPPFGAVRAVERWEKGLAESAGAGR